MDISAVISSMRLRTLPLAIVCVFAGVYAVSISKEVNWVIVGLILATSILLQVFSNLANDYGDFKNGADGDFRSDRGLSSGKITYKEMKFLVWTFGLLSFGCGLLLLWMSFHRDIIYFLIFLVIGLLAIWAAYRYTAGRNPYGYSGLGDLSVIVFFGFISVLGTYFLQTRTLSWQVILLSLGVGSFAVTVLNINNIRDIDTDREAGKDTIPVKLGKGRSILYQYILLGVGVTCTSVFAILYDLYGSLLALMLIGPAFIIYTMRLSKTTESKKYNELLKIDVLLIVLYSIIYWLGGKI